MALIEQFTPGGNLYAAGSSTFAMLVQLFRRMAENRDVKDADMKTAWEAGDAATLALAQQDATTRADAARTGAVSDANAYTDASFAASAPGGATDETVDAAVDRAILSGRIGQGHLPPAVLSPDRVLTAGNVGSLVEATPGPVYVPMDATGIPVGSEIAVSGDGAALRPQHENLVGNPRAAVSTAGAGVRGATSLSRVTSPETAFRATATSTSSFGLIGWSVDLAAAGIRPGDTISARATLTLSTGTQVAGLALRFRGGTSTVSEVGRTDTAGTGTRYIDGLTVPLGADNLQVVLYATPTAAGNTVDMTRVMVGRGPARLTTFVDGDTPGATWTGEIYNSPSAGPALTGDPVIPEAGRTIARHLGGGAWSLTPVGTAADVLTAGDALLSDRDNGQSGITAPMPVIGKETRTLFANRGYAVRFVPSRDMAITRIGFRVTTAHGSDEPVQVGIAAADGTRLVASSVTTGMVNSVGTKTVDIATTHLTAGVTYYALLATPGTPALEFGLVIGDAYGTTMPQGESFIKNTQYPLPAALTGMAVQDTGPFLFVRES